MTIGNETKRKTVLVIGYGNPGRQDDGLGPILADEIDKMNIPGVSVDSDYQLTVEDAAAVAEHDVVIFIDAAVSGTEPFCFKVVEPAEELSFSSHSVSPESVMFLAKSVFNSDAAAYILGIRGYQFDMFDETLTDKATSNLDAARAFLESTIRNGTFSRAITE